jgi:hypothetical protein
MVIYRSSTSTLGLCSKSVAILTRILIEIIVAGLVGAETDTPREIVKRVSALRGKYFHHDPRFFFVLDEAQISAR